MRRRQFIAGLGGAAAWPLAARAQQTTMPVIGVLYGSSETAFAGPLAAVRRGLSETGFVEGRNVAIEYRWADNQPDRLPAFAADLVGRQVTVILVGGGDVAVRTAMATTKTIPIVFRTASDPVAAGFVTSLNRPGGNVTGNTNISRELMPKQLALLREVIPTASKIGLLVNPNNPRVSQDSIEAAQAAARLLGLEIVVVHGGNESEIDNAVAKAVQQRAAALVTNSDAYLNGRYEQLAALGLRHTLPTMAPGRQSVVAGQLMSYAADSSDGWRQAGAYVGRILNGEKPADLPVMQPTKFELVINLKTAKAIGLTVPEISLVRADEVIE
jgi:putative tryptophan/tyrosine transport system substrate-binding protein